MPVIPDPPVAVSPGFNQAAINTLISNISSGARKLNVFQQVLTHEPKSAPQHDITMAFWVTDLVPSPKFSGLGATAGMVTFNHRIYVNFKYKPEDAIESKLLTGVSSLINGYTTDFSLGETVINVDLLGMDSQGLSAKTGYAEIDRINFRIADLTVPVLIDQLWIQEP